MNYGEKAAELFLAGYNCAQAVAVAFCDVTGLGEKETARMVSGFGGGMGRMREVCGAVSGMVFVMGYVYGYGSPDEDKAKAELYRQIQDLAEVFRKENGSIVCRELLKNPASDPNPSPRTPEYYAKRPCVRMVYTAADLLEEFMKAHPVEKANG